MIKITIPNDEYYVKRNNISELPKEPGIYKLFNKNGKLIYIGKTNNLYSRIKNHITASTNTKYFAEEIDSIKAFVVKDKTSMDIYETFLINKYLPKYNKGKVFEEESIKIENKIKTTNKSNFKNTEYEFLELNDFIFDCESRGLSKKTIKGYRNNIYLLLSVLKQRENINFINDIKTMHIRKFFKEKIDNGCSNNYINALIKVYKVFFEFCLNNGYITNNPMDNIQSAKPKKKVLKVFQDSDVLKLIEFYSFKDYLNARNKTIIALLFDTGIRVNELINIKNDSIYENKILIQGKGNKERYVLITDKLAKFLRRYELIKEKFFKDKIIDNYYFLSQNGKKLTIEAVERIYSIAGKEIGIDEQIRCSPHTSRHYFAVKMLESGNDIYTISKLLGHANVKITETYLRSITSDIVLEKLFKQSPLQLIL